MPNNTKILFLAPYPLGEAPSQRFRFELFLPILREQRIGYEFQSFYSKKSWVYLYKDGFLAQKLTALIKGYARRLKMLGKIHKYDYVFIHRELTAFGPPVYEWIISSIFKKKIIYDFDDSIWLPDQANENPFWQWLKWRSKVRSICKWSWKVSAGNEFLAEFARQYCQQVSVLPTVVDTKIHKPQPPKLKPSMPVIGWTGSHSTLVYLDQLLPVLLELEKTHSFDLVVIANQNPQLPLKNFRFIKWSKETEVDDLAKIDIGVMPLEDNDWAKGKCGFKLIQYLALEIAAVASPVGVNSKLVTNGETGLTAVNEIEWKEKLIQLLADSQLRKKLGKNGRQLVEKKYSVSSQKDMFLDLFL